MTEEVFKATQKRNTEWAYEAINECFHCGYHYADEGDEFPRCHFEGWTAPCEYEEEEDYDED